MSSYTVAQARNHLSDLLDETGTGPIEITRRGKPVAVVLSLDEYRRLSGIPRIVDKIRDYRERNAAVLAEMSNEDWPVPQRSPGRHRSPWT